MNFKYTSQLLIEKGICQHVCYLQSRQGNTQGITSCSLFWFIGSGLTEHLNLADTKISSIISLVPEWITISLLTLFSFDLNPTWQFLNATNFFLQHIFWKKRPPVPSAPNRVNFTHYGIFVLSGDNFWVGGKEPIFIIWRKKTARQRCWKIVWKPDVDKLPSENLGAVQLDLCLGGSALKLSAWCVLGCFTCAAWSFTHGNVIIIATMMLLSTWF